MFGALLMARLAFAELLRVAEAQLDAARRADAQSLQALADERQRIQQELDVEALFGLAGDDRDDVRRMAVRLKAVDARTRACGETVLNVVSTVLPDSAPLSYSRRGLLRSA